MAKKNQSLIKVLLFILLLVAVFWPRRNIIAEWQTKRRIEKEIYQWEIVLEKYPGYRDLYLRLALLYWQIGNQEKGREYFQKAEFLDPNFSFNQELRSLFELDN